VKEAKAASERKGNSYSTVGHGNAVDMPASLG